MINALATPLGIAWGSAEDLEKNLMLALGLSQAFVCITVVSNQRCPQSLWRAENHAFTILQVPHRLPLGFVQFAAPCRFILALTLKDDKGQGHGSVGILTGVQRQRPVGK
ncbi:hypothetical protein HOLleu_38228 [Holothuria leucospilota]|uniref:Uncharacterized protein n=1 Tax=Holothuria leucospilota TaxID=206669 RepID=A0A9Q1BF37_HOLLE|nr:hypothetical protein HOLleu_38228 [Holothuria leucospilota]